MDMDYVVEDSEHEIAKLPATFELHRFTNRKAEFSALYVDGEEIKSCLRQDEPKMLQEYLEELNPEMKKTTAQNW